MRLLLVVAALFLVAPHVREAFNEPRTYGDHYVSGQLRVTREAKRGPGGSLVNHGDYSSFYENGQVEMTGRYENGERVGKWRWFYENGQRKAECDYDDGEGVYRSWYPSGARLHEGWLSNEKRVRDWVEFFESGAKAMEGGYVDDLQHGTWTYWEEGRSNPAFRIEWKYGERVSD